MLDCRRAVDAQKCHRCRSGKGDPYCVEVGALTVPQHALDAARDDGLSEADIEAVLEVGDVVADRSHPERWCVKCPGSAIVVVELEADPWTVVITAFYP